MPTSAQQPRLEPNTAAVLAGVGDIRYEERPVPGLAADEVLIRVEAVGICGSDVHYYRHGRIGSYVVNQPLILGHETSGTIVAVGAAVQRHALGDRVAVEPGVPCGRCEQCRSGRYNLCPAVVFHGTPPVDGTLQRYIAMREDFVFTLPDSVSLEAGALVEPLAVAVWACRKAGIQPGSRVLVTGAGPVGLLTAQAARAFGASKVVITDLDPVKLETALRLGVDEALDPRGIQQGLSDDFTAHIECSGSAAATATGIRHLGPAGVSVLVGMGAQGGLDVPISLIQERELRITGTFRYADCYPAAIDLLASGKVRAEELVSARYRLEQTELALSSSGEPGILKSLILPGRTAQG